MTGNVLRRFTSNEPDDDEDEDSHPSYGIGSPIRIGTRQPRLRVHFADGTVSIFSYGYLMEATLTTPQHLVLVYPNCVLTLRGQNLARLLEPLQDEKVRWLRCVTTQVENAPDEVLIEDIERHNVDEVLKGVRKK